MTTTGDDSVLPPMPTAGPDHRAGFVSFVGRPNVGKSTLTNALVGEKVAITSSKPQTTRRAIRGIVHHPAGQLVLVDQKGARYLVPAARIAYVEIGPSDSRRVGFISGD